MKLVTISILLCILMKCDAKPDGAPLRACTDLNPIHEGGRIKPSATQSPYFVSAIPSGNKVKVTISSLTEDFQGFILQARSKENRDKFVNGQFTVIASPHAMPLGLKQDLITSGSGQPAPDTKTIDCFNKKKNTLTHLDTSLKRAVVTEWTPDPDVNEDVVFRATVAKTYYKFWIKVYSHPVSIYSGGVVSGKENKATDPLYEGCFISKGCVGLPKDCAVSTRDCKVLLTYYSVPSGVKFSMHGHLDTQTYMAMGLSEDDKMGEDSVNECIRDHSDVIVRESRNEGKSNSRTKDLPDADYQSSLVNGLASCSWIKPFDSESDGREIDLINNNYHILLAKGNVNDDFKLQFHTEMTASAEALNFTIFEEHEDWKDSEIDEMENVPTTASATEIHDEITTSSDVNYTEDSKSHSSHLSFNIFCVILTFLFASKHVFLQG